MDVIDSQALPLRAAPAFYRVVESRACGAAFVWTLYNPEETPQGVLGLLPATSMSQA